MYRFNSTGGTTSDEKWQKFAGKGWSPGSVNLETCDLGEEWKKYGDGIFMARFKIYMSMAPTGAVSVVEMPYSTSSSVDGSVIQMHSHGYRYHMLTKIISHVREKGYNLVPQSQIKKMRKVATVVNETTAGLTGSL